jgi:hypothetical protein
MVILSSGWIPSTSMVQSDMPFTFNGIGTALSGYSSPISFTDEILAHPEIQAALPPLRREPWRRGEFLRA